MPYPFWNKKEDENVVCWKCEHFQRRDNTEDTDNCQGECRKNPVSWGGTMYNDTDAASGDLESAFAFVPFGNTTWCNGFQRSLEENIPNPIAGRANCRDQTAVNWESPRDNMIANAPRENKKTMLETCWYCEHFQRDPENQTPGTPCGGFCFIAPPPGFELQNGNWEGAGNTRMELWYANAFIQNSAYFWCSRWERSRTEVPDPPEFDGVPCQGGA